MSPHLVDVHLLPDLVARPQKHPFYTQLEYDTWAELLIKTNHNSFGRPDPDPMFGPWARRPLPSPAAADVFKFSPPPQQNAMMEEGAAFELSFRDFVEKKTQPEVAVAPKKSKQRRESRMGGLFLIKAFIPLVLDAVVGHRKIASGGVDKAGKVTPNPCQDNGSSNHNGGSRNSGRRASCYVFLHRDRSGPIEI